MNILILPGTTLIAREIRVSLEAMREVHLYGAGFDLAHPDTKLYKDFFYLGQGLTEANLDRVSKIVQDFEIQMIFLAHDQYLLDFKDYTEISGAKIVHHNSRSIEITSYKSKTYKCFKKWIPTPNIFTIDFAMEKQDEYYVKPDRGQGGVGGFHAINFDLTKINPKSHLISEFLPGEEYTVDCFSSFDSKVIYAAARERLEISNGLAIETKMVHLPIVNEYSKRISQELELSGAWFFQLKASGTGELKLLEIGLRIAGASGVNRLRGINLSQMQIYQELGRKLVVPIFDTNPKVSEKGVDLDFDYQAVFLDYDDTMTIEGNARESVKTFLTKCKQREIPVSIISRHVGDLRLSLTRNFPGFTFTDIIQINDGSNKSLHIPSTLKTLFVDDSFYERSQVKKVLRNRVLSVDPSAFEYLNFELNLRI